MSKATCTIEGRVGREPDIKFTKNGETWVRLSVAVQERVKEGDQWIDGVTTWFKVTAWKRLAEQVADTIHTGDLVLATGTIKLEKWTNNNGVEMTDLALRADSIGLVMKKNTEPKREPAEEEPPF